MGTYSGHKLRDSDIEWADIVFASAVIVQKDSLELVVGRCKARGKRVMTQSTVITFLILSPEEAV